MKKKLFTMAIAAIWAIQLFAQFKINGVIRSDDTGESLSGAHISLENTLLSITSDAKGNFEIKNLKKASYSIRVTYLGYIPFEQELIIKSDTLININLIKTSIQQDAVIVIATQAPTDAPTTFKNISGKDIKNINLAQDIPYLLSSQVSVLSTSDAGTDLGYSSIRIRGTDMTRINVTVNGIPLNDPESQAVYWVNMPDFASSIDNIQIQRGIGTSTNGAGAFGASINFQTSKLSDQAYTEVSNSYGSFNTRKHSLKFGTGLINKHWAFDGRLSKIYSDGYIDRAFSDLKSFFTSTSYYGKNCIVKLNVFSGKEHTYQAWYGVPQDSLKTNRTFNPYTYENQTDNYQQDHYQLIYNQKITQVLNLNAALHFTEGRGYYEEYKEEQELVKYGLENFTIKDTTIEVTDLVRQRWLDNDFYGATYSLNYDDNKKLKINFGGGYNIYDGNHFGDVINATFINLETLPYRYYKNNAVKKDLNTFIKLYYGITEKLTAFADVQHRNVFYSFLGFDKDLNNVQQTANFNFINPKAGLSYLLNSSNTLYASFAIGNKEPNRNDFTESSIISRPKHETMYDVETGYRFSSKKISINTNLYWMNYKNQLVLTGQINDVGEYTRTNIPQSYRSGIELETAYSPFNNLVLIANIALSKNKINKFTEFIDDWDSGYQIINNYNETDIAFSPECIAAGSLKYTFFKHFYAEWFSKYVSAQYLDNTSNKQRMINSYFKSDLRFNMTISTKVIKEISFNAQLINLFNKFYESNGWTYAYIYNSEHYNDNYYFPQAGRHFLLGLSLKL